jgi:hypothetical protein
VLEKCDDDVDAFRSLDDWEVIWGVIWAGFYNRLVFFDCCYASR